MSAQMSIREALSKAEEYARQGRDQEAHGLFTAVLRRFPGNKQAKKGLKALRRRGTTTLSRADFDEVLHLCAQSRHEAALGQVRRLCRDYPEQPALLNLLGFVLTEMGRLEDALEPYGKAIALEPEFDEALNNIASVFARLERYDEALAYYQHIVRRGRADGDIYRNLAQTLRKTGRNDDAVEALQRAIKLQPLNVKSHVLLGSVLLDMEQRDAAIGAFESALAIDPDNQIARQQLLQVNSAPAPVSPPPPSAAPAPFDALAPNYENTVADLKYTLPTLIPGVLEAMDGEDAWYQRALDLGCGTGLAGLQIRSYCEHLVGVDRAQAMLIQATQKAVYDELICRDARQYLDDEGDRYDLILLLDLLPYIEEPAALMTALRRRCSDNARVVLNTESDSNGVIALGGDRRTLNDQAMGEILAATGFRRLGAQRVRLYTSGASYREGTVMLLTPDGE